ncbi:MAG: tetrathionate reductase family octaheme c-type cytochrome [Thiotrichales bacterium]
MHIVVGKKINKVAGALFWTVVFAGFGLTAALANVATSENGSETAEAVTPSGSVEMGIREYDITAKKRHVDKSVTKLGEKVEDKSTTDHSKLKELQGPFTSGPEVTKACLKCHNTAGHQFMKNKHWTWKYHNPKTGQDLGKSVLVNNFCTNAAGNEGMCAQCHAGYGMTDARTYDFTNEENIDCLACHDSTGTYYKLPPSQGNKACSTMFEGKKPIDWTKVAQSVTLPGRNNCGSCHFFGGGGDNVKHGDLSSALYNPSKEVDVHMASDGENFSCVVCHVGEGHQWAGSRYAPLAKDTTVNKPGMPRQTATCESCHGQQPHSGLIGIKLNDHTDRVACETCHIPTFAKGGVATKTHWDWRTMGRLKNGEGFREEGYVQGNGEHRHTYKSIKGSFEYGENVIPEYHWFNGTEQYLTVHDKFDPSKPVDMNHLEGSASDPDSRIWPFKKMVTIQPYDKGNNTLVYMHLWGADQDALWGNYDFAKAIKHGMEEFNLPYSGEYGFVETHSFWPVVHMVAPKEDALACQECHAREGRLKDVEGFYMPGRDYNRWVDILGIFIVIASLLGVLGHGALRMVLAKRRKSS